MLDAIPSRKRAVATDALVQWKKVTLEYNPDGVQIIVEERDGSSRCRASSGAAGWGEGWGWG